MSFAAVLLFLRDTRHKTETRLRDVARGIRCPKCAWQPGPEDRWTCGPKGCGHVWNTFETGGRCPACDRQWKDTACLRCSQWSPHDDWYQKDEG